MGQPLPSPASNVIFSHSQLPKLGYFRPITGPAIQWCSISRATPRRNPLFLVYILVNTYNSATELQEFLDDDTAYTQTLRERDITDAPDDTSASN
jgi:hypothetical protein